MVAQENPGTCGVAARLPKKPGTQKLTPPSSACAADENSAVAAAKKPTEPNRARFLAVVRCMFAPHDACIATIRTPAAAGLFSGRPRHPRPGEKSHYAALDRIQWRIESLGNCGPKAPPAASPTAGLAARSRGTAAQRLRGAFPEFRPVVHREPAELAEPEAHRDLGDVRGGSR